MALGEMHMEEWMVMVRSVDDMHFIFTLMMGCRGQVSLWGRGALPAWRKVYVSMVELAGNLRLAGAP